jgi:hypothetical protein
VNATSRRLAFAEAARVVCADDSISFVLDDHRSQNRDLFVPLAKCKKIGLTFSYLFETPEDETIELREVNGTSYVFGAGAPRDTRLVPFVDMVAARGAKTAAVIRYDRSSTIQCSAIHDDLARNNIALVTPDVVLYDSSEESLLNAVSTIRQANDSPDVLFLCTRTSLTADAIRDIRRSALNFGALHITPMLDIQEYDADVVPLLEHVTTFVEGSTATTFEADAALFGSASKFGAAFEAEWKEPLPERLVVMGTMLDMMREALLHAHSLKPEDLQVAMLTIDNTFMNGELFFYVVWF